MEIIYHLEDFPDPGDKDLFRGIQEINNENYCEALKYFVKGGTYDNEYALLFSAIFYYTGFYQRNLPKAIEIIKTIAYKYNNPVAQFILGALYFKGNFEVQKDEDMGFYWFFIAAQNGWACAIAYIGYSYQHGIVVKKDFKKALEWYLKITNKDDNEADLINDGTLYLFGNKKFQLNLTQVREVIVERAFMIARNTLALPSTFFCGCEDPKIAFWDTLTNKKSSAVAMCQLYISSLYTDEQNNISRNINTAIFWERKAAKNENASACSQMALRYEEGTYVRQNFEKAIQWYKKAYYLGENTCFQIGVLYYRGVNVKRDWEQAMFYLQRVNEPCYHSMSQFYVGYMLERGQHSAVQDYKNAFSNYSEAFTNGNSYGAYFIALLYSRGLGVQLDEKEAITWFNKAVSMGCKAASQALAAIGEKGFNRAISDIVRLRDSKAFF